jgi:hypothetical protein
MGLILVKENSAKNIHSFKVSDILYSLPILYYLPIGLLSSLSSLVNHSLHLPAISM